MPSSPDRYSIVFGDGHELPGIEAIADWNFRTFSDNTLEQSSSIASLPDYPECVVRNHSIEMGSPEDCLRVAHQGIAHYMKLAEQGISLPAQRLVVGPAHYDQIRYTLYGFTEYIPGRELTARPGDAELSKPVIEATAGYIADVYNDPSQQELLWDIGDPWQYTVTPDNKVILHDVDLQFGSKRLTSEGLNLPQYAAINLRNWARSSGIERGTNLRALLRAVNPTLMRKFRNRIFKS